MKNVGSAAPRWVPGPDPRLAGGRGSPETPGSDVETRGRPSGLRTNLRGGRRAWRAGCTVPARVGKLRLLLAPPAKGIADSHRSGQGSGRRRSRSQRAGKMAGRDAGMTRGHCSPAPLSGILYIYEFSIARYHPVGIICVTIRFRKACEKRCKVPSTPSLQRGPDCFPARFTKCHLSNVTLCDRRRRASSSSALNCSRAQNLGSSSPWESPWDPNASCGRRRRGERWILRSQLDAFVLAGGALDRKAVALLRINTFLKKRFIQGYNEFSAS